jgi:hypothetical protein
MRFACRDNEGKNTDTHTNTDTLCNTYCIVTAGMVTQTRLGVTL